MRRILDKYYPENRFINIIFDVFFFMYLLSYFVFYQDGYETIRAISTIGVILFGILIAIPQWQFINQYTCWYFCFIVFGILSIVWAKSSSQITSLVITLARILFVSYFLSKRVKREEDIEIIFSMYCLTILVLDLFVGKIMIDYYSLNGLISVRFGDNFMFNSNTIAVGNIIAILIVAHRIVYKKKNIIPIIVDILIAIFYLIIIFLTESKKGILGLLLGLSLYLYYKGNSQKKRLGRICLIVIFILISLQLLQNIPFLYETIGHRLETFIGSSSTIDGSTQNRETLIKEAAELWSEHPLLGVGLNNFAVYQTLGGTGYYAHSNYMELLADLGIVGFILYYFMPFKLALTKIDQQSDLQILLKVICIVFLVLDLAMVSYQDIRIQLFFMLQYITHYGGILEKIGESE